MLHFFFFFSLQNLSKQEDAVHIRTCCSPIAYVSLVVCERVLHDGLSLFSDSDDGHRSIFVVVHAGPSPAEGLGGLTPPVF